MKNAKLLLLGLIMVSPVTGAISALTPSQVSASGSVDDTDFDESNLIDGDTSVLTVGLSQGIGDDYAGSGAGPHMLVFDFGNLYDFTDVFYAQRNDTVNLVGDDVLSIRVWFLVNDPGPASVALSSSLGPENLTLSPDGAKGVLQQFTVSAIGRFVAAELIGRIGFDPGGAEFRFDGNLVPEPSASLLLILGGVVSLGYRRRVS